MRADGHDGPGDLVEAAEQLDLDLLARVMALLAGRHDEQAVRADQRGKHAGAARQRGGDHGPADHAEPDPDPVVHAERGGQLAGQPGRRPRPLPWRRAGQFGQ